MVRNRILAALLALPLAACTVEGSDESLTENTGDVGSLSSADVKAALSVIPGVEVVGKHADGVIPFYVRGDFGSTGQSVRGLAARDVSAQMGDSLGRIAPIFRLNAADLVVRSSRVDEQGQTHVRYAQTKNGLPVVGEELVVHVDRDGRIYAVNGTARDGENVPAVARISREAASQSALRNTEGSRLSSESAQQVYYRPEGGRLQLAYEVVVTGEGADLPVRDHVFVSARDGSILGRYTDIRTALNRKVYSANNGTSTPGTLKRSEGGAATGDNHVDTNYAKLGGTYDCYKNNFGRDSLNNAGATLISTVHYSTNYVNAYWDGTQMVYGDGDGVNSTMLGLSADVTTHELTHAVTENESNLTYSGESGGLNEAMSDIFGAYCESYASGTWATTDAVFMVGDDIWTPATPGDALRYMYDPAKDGASLDFWTSSAGSKDVHYSSGIANLAFTLLSKGGTHPRGKSTTVVTGIGVQKAGAIFYKANVDLMTPSTTFAQARTYTESAATTLYGAGSAELAAVTAAWQAVGVGSGTTPPPSCTSTIALSNGVTVTGISANASDWSCTYTLAVPSGASNLSFALSGGTGDGDMYVKFGAAPTSTTYDCRPYLSGNAETCNFATPQVGTYYVKIYGYSAASGMSLKGSYSTGGGGGGGTMTNGVATAAYSGASGSWTCNTLVIPSGVSSVVFTQAGGTGDADMYVRFGSAPTTSTYACRPYLSGNSESCTISAPSAGTWYACSYGYTSYTSTTMKGTY
ncbi:M4 family metallopeptidase [Vitiosangium sp. GDMCC 1.1324]|uniref:M4 family metallopeptidase n=1 Tax=Vitiosangium sp. (strain GDMCC 1.1324) TaxID=2138576 RepID=UPI000D3D464D|nr:M4 family metallopeptidase [Vitiosangium sp. GDMCC 1.1324]PTL81461.1 peptidase M4 [Vitiosangium sp. GDMCC 1.1324]